MLRCMFESTKKLLLLCCSAPSYCSVCTPHRPAASMLQHACVRAFISVSTGASRSQRRQAGAIPHSAATRQAHSNSSHSPEQTSRCGTCAKLCSSGSTASRPRARPSIECTAVAQQESRSACAGPHAHVNSLHVSTSNASCCTLPSCAVATPPPVWLRIDSVTRRKAQSTSSSAKAGSAT